MKQEISQFFSKEIEVWFSESDRKGV